MRRPHRSIETFDISLMAVVTKAMGAFLVLMLLLMPYYSSSPLGKEEAQELAHKVQEADQKIARVLETLGPGDSNSVLSSAREELGSGQKLIDQLKRAIDQMGAQVVRLDGKVAALTKDLEKLKSDNAAQVEKIAKLEKDNKTLKEENEKLLKQVADLTKERDDLKKKVEDLEKQIEELKSHQNPDQDQLQQLIAQLRDQIAQLNGLVASLRSDITQLKDRADSLQREVDQLKSENQRYIAENESLHATNADLKRQLDKLQRDYDAIQGISFLAATAFSNDCSDSFYMGFASPGLLINGQENFVDTDIGWGISQESGKNSSGTASSSSLYVPGIQSKTNFIYVMFRAAAKEGKPGPLVIPHPCTVYVDVTIRYQGSAYHTWRAQTVDATTPIVYALDVNVAQDGVHFTSQSGVGAAWIKGQLDNAHFDRTQKYFDDRKDGNPTDDELIRGHREMNAPK